MHSSGFIVLKRCNLHLSFSNVPTLRCLFFSFTGSEREGKGKAIRETAYTQWSLYGRHVVKADLNEKRSIFVLWERGTHTAWGFLYKKRHIVTNFIIKCLFPKIAVFNSSLSRYVIYAVLYIVHKRSNK